MNKHTKKMVERIKRLESTALDLRREVFRNLIRGLSPSSIDKLSAIADFLLWREGRKYSL